MTRLLFALARRLALHRRSGARLQSSGAGLQTREQLACQKSSPTVLLLLGLLVIGMAIALAACTSGELRDGANLLARTASGGSAPWSMFGKNQLRNARSEHRGPQTSVVNWKYSLATETRSSPVIGSDGTLYFGSNSDSRWTSRFYAVSSSGKLKWKYTLPGDSGDSTISSAPAIGSDGSIYFGSVNKKFYALKPDGTLKWSFLAGAGFGMSSPAIGANGTIYVGCSDSKMYAISSSGSLVWTFTTGGVVYSCPAVGQDGTIYFGSNDSNLYALNADGTMKWSYAASGSIRGGPAIAETGVLYFGDNNGVLYALNPDGSLVWSHQLRGRVSFSSPAIGADGTVYIGCYRASSSDPFEPGLAAITSSGSESWFYQSGMHISSSPSVDVDGTVYVNSGNKFLAIDNAGGLKWSYNYNLYNYSSPAIGDDGTIYVGGSAPSGSGSPALYAFGPGTP